jgi:hypothetical protein
LLIEVRRQPIDVLVERLEVSELLQLFLECP